MAQVSINIPTLFDNDDFTEEFATILQKQELSCVVLKALEIMQDIQQMLKEARLEIDSLWTEGQIICLAVLKSEGERRWLKKELCIALVQKGCYINFEFVAFENVKQWLSDWINDFKREYYRLYEQEPKATNYYTYYGISPNNFI